MRSLPLILCLLLYLPADCAESTSCAESSDSSDLLQVHGTPKASHSKSFEDFISDAVEDLVDFLESHVSLSAQHLKVLKEMSARSPWRTQMIGLSFWTYGIHTFVNGWAGWTLAKKFIDTRPKNGAPGYDVAALFVKDVDTCALVFAGTTGLADVTSDLTFNAISPRDYAPCGLEGVHEGFFNDVQQFMLNGSYEHDFEPFLHLHCSGGITLAGHSQGAAMAEILASCANHGDTLWIPELKRGDKVINAGAQLKTRFQVNSIYTAGSPGTARVSIKNPLSTSGVFQGERIFIQDWIYMDPVPPSVSEFDFWHPTMQAVRLYKSNETAVHAETIASATAWKPPLLLPTPHSLAVLDVKLHLEYISWLVALV